MYSFVHWASPARFPRYADWAAAAAKRFAEARAALGLSADELLREWSEHGATRLLPGLYLARLEHEGVYVANGFYPAMREPFADPAGPGVMTFELSFDLPWRDFNEVVVGDENPAGALEESIRGFLNDRCDALGIRIDRYDNLVHASASPLESVLDRRTWRPASAWRDDPFLRRLGPAAANDAALDALRDDEDLLAAVRGLDEAAAAAALGGRGA